MALKNSPSPPPTRRRKQHLVLVGGGHSHVQVIKGLNHLSTARQTVDLELEITVIDITDSPVYSGMVPGNVAGIYTPIESRILLRPLCDWAHIKFIQDRVIDINVETKTITTANANTKSISFDVVSVDIGSTSRGWDVIRGTQNYCIPTRPLSRLVTQIEMATDLLTKAGPSSFTSLNVIVVGGGAAGVEFAMSLVGRWQPIVDRSHHGTMTVTLLNSSPILFPDESDATREAVLHQLEKRGIEVINNAIVKDVNEHLMTVEVTQPPSELVEKSGDTSESSGGKRASSSKIVYTFTHCVWATGAECHHPLSSSFRDNGLALSDQGWIEVNKCLQSISHPFVFASGDCCLMVNTSPPPPKTGVYTVRAGPILLENLKRYLLNDNTSLQAYVPQTGCLTLIGCGDGTAQGFQCGIPFYGTWVFQLKDAMDRTCINLFKKENLPELIDDDGLVYDASLQFDTITSTEDRPAMILPPPMDDVLLLQRTDDEVDYQQAWQVLREMTTNKTYREEVVLCYHQSTHRGYTNNSTQDAQEVRTVTTQLRFLHTRSSKEKKYYAYGVQRYRGERQTLQDKTNDETVQERKTAQTRILELGAATVVHERQLEDEHTKYNRLLEDEFTKNNRILEDEFTKNNRILEDKDTKNYRIREDERIKNNRLLEDE